MSVNAYLDVGNSRIKLAVGGKPGADLQSEAFAWPKDAHDADRMLEDLAGLLRSSMERLGRRKIKRFYLASVVEKSRYDGLIAALEQVAPQAEMVPLVVKKRCCRVRTDYELDQLGVDRFCAVVEAYARAEHGAVIVINCGTAVTIDAVSADGVHQGGFIMPGLHAALSGLQSAAPALAALSPKTIGQPLTYSGQGFQHSRLGLPLETQSGCVAGMRLMYGAGIEQSVVALKAALVDNGAVKVMLSGGDASQLVDLLDPDLHCRVEPNLVLSGVLRLARVRR